MAGGGIDLYLASRSPRRVALLEQLGVRFALIDGAVDESVRADESPAAYVARMAMAKVRAGRRGVAVFRPILAADTIVVADDTILGTPATVTQACAMLQTLSGRWHEVLTCVAVDRGDALQHRVVSAKVCLRRLPDPLLARYCATGEPMDKAGAYGIQGLGGALVERIEGSYSAVVGLPLCETSEMLQAAGVPHALSA